MFLYFLAVSRVIREPGRIAATTIFSGLRFFHFDHSQTPAVSPSRLYVGTAGRFNRTRITVYVQSLSRTLTMIITIMMTRVADGMAGNVVLARARAIHQKTRYVRVFVIVNDLRGTVEIKRASEPDERDNNNGRKRQRRRRRQRLTSYAISCDRFSRTRCKRRGIFFVKRSTRASACESE